eukprot:CAMPEP_0206427420 /NCGR_PEP_ID=MMETSP0324_2-20121206/5025_1 /ASSEMBLY_ACC=CAM_ASM_000836 /TAXON_ID=2866 /ORGANISM="Crypthecodinium cohnii, Strain Seligo" /LENGTH=325 /DNA_ID=CAMNT_0053892687 /DNA_START=16 /DNA_END=993 /DNA_ORIENTATION=-
MASAVRDTLNMALVVELEELGQVRRILMPTPLDPTTWQAELRTGSTSPFLQEATEDPVLKRRLVAALVSVTQDNDGQHRFLALADVLAGRPLEASKLLDESTAKSTGFELLYARPEDFRAAAPGPSVTSSDNLDIMALVQDEMAPKLGYVNYSVVPWLCLGKKQRVLLSDETTLKNYHIKEKILEYVSLVVNCHEEGCDHSKYRVGQSSPNRRPDVITEAVHTWFSGPSAEKNHQIQCAIWQHLEQGGSVAVHCLAGIHRAACIVACQFLFRYHVLGHTHVPHEVDDIYRKLKSVRPHVSPAYQRVFQEYEVYVKSMGRSSKSMI